MAIWGFPSNNPKKTKKKKSSPSAKKRAAKRAAIQTEQPVRPVPNTDGKTKK